MTKYVIEEKRLKELLEAEKEIEEMFEVFDRMPVDFSDVIRYCGPVTDEDLNQFTKLGE